MALQNGNNAPNNLEGNFAPISPSKENLPPSFEVALENNSTSEIPADNLQESDNKEDSVSSSAGGAPLPKTETSEAIREKWFGQKGPAL